MPSTFKAAKVVISGTLYDYDIEYTYSISDEFINKVVAGVRVLVPFGRSNKKKIGLVTRVYEKDYNDTALKPIINVIDNEPCVNDEFLKLIFWLKENTFCTFFEAFNSVIPKGLGVNLNAKYTFSNENIDEILTFSEAELVEKLKNCKNQKQFDKIIAEAICSGDNQLVSSLVSKNVLKENNEFKRNIGDESIKMVRFTKKYLDNQISIKLSDKQNQIISMLEECGRASVKEISYLCGVSTSVVNTLCKKEVLETYNFEVMRSVCANKSSIQNPNELMLSSTQKQVYDGIKNLIDENVPSGALLYGVTGSGKTSVFIKLINYTLSIGKTALMLIPEISLTPQMVNKFSDMFGQTVAVIHSSLSVGQRLDEYKRIKRGEASIVIGTRSAVFAPLKDIGIIIMDEEGEWTYKSERSPRFHARDVAIQRCGYHNAVLLMASATPSIETYYYAKTGRFKLFELNERYSNSVLPDVMIVDMQLQYGNNGIFSNELIDGINKNLKNKEQTIILLNRRGFHTYITCLDCREPIECPHCSVPMTYHKVNNMLMCHYCGYHREVDEKCPKCQSVHLKPTGSGTQRIEDELQRLFPEARVLRMDADTTYSRYSYEKNFKDFGDGKYDIMIGTQMIAKGLDFSNVTLVGVLSLDKALFASDFRSYERTFSLLTQVAGRSGRGDKKGVAYIQTFAPEHYVINLAAKQDYKAFFEEEIALRKVLIYPPFCDMCVVGFSGLEEYKVEKASKMFVKIISDYIKKNDIKIPLRLLGPSKCNLGRINNKYRYRIIIKCKSSKEFRELIRSSLKTANKIKEFSNINVYADINGDIGL